LGQGQKAADVRESMYPSIEMGGFITPPHPLFFCKNLSTQKFSEDLLNSTEKANLLFYEKLDFVSFVPFHKFPDRYFFLGLR
jgi:hypothetical protein